MPKILCIDEVYAYKGRDSKYACVLLDFQSQKIVDVLPSRRKQYLSDYFSHIPKAKRDKVDYISIDMLETYRDISKVFFPMCD